jgi:hypothetical protein
LRLELEFLGLIRCRAGARAKLLRHLARQPDSHAAEQTGRHAGQTYSQAMPARQTRQPAKRLERPPQDEAGGAPCRPARPGSQLGQTASRAGGQLGQTASRARRPARPDSQPGQKPARPARPSQWHTGQQPPPDEAGGSPCRPGYAMALILSFIGRGIRVSGN